MKKLAFGFLSPAMLCAGLTACPKEDAPAATPTTSTQAEPAKAAVPGVTDTTVTFGSHLPLTGPLAVYGEMAKAAKGYFDYVNDQGGVHGRKIIYKVEDNVYEPARALEVTKKLVEKDGVFAMFMPGTPAHAAAMGYLAEKGVPDLIVANPSRELTNPIVKTRFRGPNLAFYEEAAFAVTDIAAKYPGKKIGFLGENSSVGEDALAGAKSKGAKFDVEAMYDAATQNTNTQIMKLKKANVDVVLFFGWPGALASSVKFAAQNNFKPVWWASGVNQMDAIIQMAGPEAIEGVQAPNFFKFENDTEDPAVKKHIEILTKYAPGVKFTNLTMYSQGAAEILVEALKRAGPNLTREGIVEAMESMNKWDGCSLCLGPVSYSPTDHDGLDGGDIKMAQVKDGHWKLRD